MPETSENPPTGQAETKPTEETSKVPQDAEPTASPRASTSQQPASPSSPKPSPPPIITTPPVQIDSMTNSIMPDTSIMATTPAAMETAMKFEVEEAIRKSMNPEEADRNAITEAPAAADASEAEAAGIVITLLILSGARTTFTINQKFLTKHNVPHQDAMQMTVYNLKECIWRDWKDDDLNTKQPASPHLIRLILLGRLLEDKSLLKDSRLNTEAPNVVHLSLRPADVSEDEVTTKSGKFPTFSGSGNRGDRSSPGCRCVIL